MIVLPWFPDDTQYRKSSIRGPTLRKQMYMNTACPLRKKGPGRGGVGRADLKAISKLKAEKP